MFDTTETPFMRFLSYRPVDNATHARYLLNNFEDKTVRKTGAIDA